MAAHTLLTRTDLFSKLTGFKVGELNDDAVTLLDRMKKIELKMNRRCKCFMSKTKRTKSTERAAAEDVCHVEFRWSEINFYSVCFFCFFLTCSGTFAVISLMIGGVAMREAPDSMFYVASANGTNMSSATAAVLDVAARDARRVQVAIVLTTLVGIIQVRLVRRGERQKSHAAFCSSRCSRARGGTWKNRGICKCHCLFLSKSLTDGCLVTFGHTRPPSSIWGGGAI